MKQKILIISFIFLSQICFAITPFYGVISNSLGGAGRAAVTPEEVGLLNPAALAHQKGYQLSTAYRNMNVRNDGSIYDFTGHISENQPDTMFPLSVLYHKQTNFHYLAHNRIEDLHLTTANMMIQNVAYGIDVQHHKLDGVIQDQDEWDASLGFLYVPIEDLGIGLVYKNFLDSDSSYLNRSIEVGVNYIFQKFLRVSADIAYPTQENPDHEAIYMLGFEHKLSDAFPLRAGYRSDDIINENYWSLGLGWVGPKLGLGFVLERNFSETGEFSTGFDLKVYF